MNLKLLKKQSGATITETVIYISIISIITVGVIAIILQLVNLKLSADSSNAISQEAVSIFEYIINDLREGDSFTVVDSEHLEIDKGGEIKEYYLQEGKIFLNENTEDYQITSNLVTVTNLEFVDWTSINSDNLLHIELELTRGEINEQYQTSVHTR